MSSVSVAGAPFENDVENLGADNSGEDEGDAEVPGVFGFDALFFGVADADPEAYQDAGGDQDAVGGDAEAADLEKSGKHLLIRCGGWRESQLLGGASTGAEAPIPWLAYGTAEAVPFQSLCDELPKRLCDEREKPTHEGRVTGRE